MPNSFFYFIFTAVLAGEEKETYTTWLILKTIRGAGLLKRKAELEHCKVLLPAPGARSCGHHSTLPSTEDFSDSQESFSSSHFLVMETK